MKQRTYIAIDLKSFYASVECRARGLDPLDTNLVVADESRTDKTICLAVSPSLKSHGIPGRARLFEVKQQVKEANASRLMRAPGRRFNGTSHFHSELEKDPSLGLDFLIARPRMALYMECSTKIYAIYMKYVAPEDVVVYSIDEVFMDVTDYLNTYGLSPRDLAMKIIRDVLDSTGITATAGISSNLYLCKVAMDVMAKHVPADENGVRIAELDEREYRRKFWSHRPITDFWRVGHGIARRLEKFGIFTMGDIALCSVQNEELLYREFGKNAELLIDHAWGWEPCTMRDIKAYHPEENSIGSGQVLQSPYTAEKAKLVLMEMADALALALVEKELVTDQIVVTVSYDIENLRDPERKSRYHGEVVTDRYGRRVPKHAHGTASLKSPSSSSRQIMAAAEQVFDRSVDPDLLIRRLNITACRVTGRNEVPDGGHGNEQFSLFTDPDAEEALREAEKQDREKELRLQQATLAIKKKYGKNAILRGMSLLDGATAVDRNSQIGGHRA